MLDGPFKVVIRESRKKVEVWLSDSLSLPASSSRSARRRSPADKSHRSE